MAEGHLTEKTFGGKDIYRMVKSMFFRDIWRKGHLAEETFTGRDIYRKGHLAEGTFDGWDISRKGHLPDKWPQGTVLMAFISRSGIGLLKISSRYKCRG